MKNGKLGCLLWVALFLIIVLWGWKLINFYVLEPAAVKKGMNETLDQVSRIGNAAAKQVAFQAEWAEWERSCGTVFSITSFSGDSFVVEWTDTLDVPVFPSIGHSFRLTRLVQ